MFSIQNTCTKFSWHKTFAALKYPNYRLWFIGQIISLIGTWVQITAQSFLLYELTHSMAYLGYIGLASGFPSIVLMLYGGVLADRFPRRNLLIITQTIMMILAFILFALVFFNVVKPWHILFLATVLGIVNAFDVPSRQAFVFELVDKKELGNAIALNSTMFNLAAVVGPSLAGILYSYFGASWCFIVNGISFLGIIIILFRMKIASVVPIAREKTLFKELAVGISYCCKHETIRLLIIILAVISCLGMSYTTLLPAWAINVLHGDAATNGYLHSARGVGSLGGALLMASLGDISKRYRLLYWGIFLFPVFLFFFAVNNYLLMSLLCLAGVGFGLMIIFNTLNTLIQALVDNKLRGRVLSIYSLAFFGGMPIGAFITGNVAELIGARTTILISAIASLAAAGIFYIKSKKLRLN